MLSIAAISEQFTEFGLQPSEDVLEKSLDICQKYGISDPSEFVEQWLAFSVSYLNGADPTLDLLDEMERKKFQNVKKERAPYTYRASVPKQEIYSFSGKTTDPDREDDDLMETYGWVKKTTATITSQESISDSEKDGNSIKIVYTFGNPLITQSATWMGSEDRHKVIIKLHDQQQYSGTDYKYLHDQLREKCTVEANKCVRLRNKLFAEVRKVKTSVVDGQQDTDIEWDQSSNDGSSIYFGRISSDTEHSKLTDTSTILIETNVDELRTYQLDFQRLPSVQIFPGQMCAISGVRPRGDTIYVKELWTDWNRTTSIVPIVVNDISMLAVAGPFTSIDNLNFSGLNKLLVYCRQHKPDVLLLIGPFLDSENVLLKNSTLHDSFETFFEKMIAGIMDTVGPNCQVMIVSSQRDIHSTLIYPTQSFNLRQTYSNIHLLPDPCLVNINGMIFGITATDVVGQISDIELARNAGEKIKRIVNHLFQQQSFYPIHPPDDDVNYDTQLADSLAQLNFIPNVLILPSALKYYVRNVSNCIAINPGKLSETDAGGTFARLIIQPPPTLNSTEPTMIDCTGCQVVKI